MADVDEIIDYMKALRRGFDKNLFQSKVDELSHAVDTSGLDYEDFQTLFKIWLNLSIPITKWVNLGSCLVPSEMVQEKTVAYSLRWIMANLDNQSNHSRIGFLLDWLTAAMECKSIDMRSLDAGYEVFYNTLTFEALTVHSVKLIYTLTKPADVTRKRALELIVYAQSREGKKNLYRQLQVVLGLFKSYKPECVPEEIPAFSIVTAFKKIKQDLLARFMRNMDRRNGCENSMQHLLWTNSNNEHGRNKKADPLVPHVEFIRMKKQSEFEEPVKTAMDFSDPASLLAYSCQHSVSSPARLRSFLCNNTGHVLLAMMPHSQQAFLSHDLHHLLNNCFLEVSPHTYSEKQDLLKRLGVFQHTLVQGIPVVTRFLAQYLLLWNETDYFAEILELCEWVSVDSPEHVQSIVGCLSAVYLRAQPLEQCAILRTLTHMYTNMLYASTKKRQHFLNTPSANNYTALVNSLGRSLARLCSQALQADPEDYRVLYSSVQSSRTCGSALSQLSVDTGPALPGTLTLALPLLTPSPGLIDQVAELIITYKNIISKQQNKNEQIINILSKYTTDLLNCLYSEEAFIRSNEGLIFQHLDPKLVDNLGSLIPNVDGMLSIRNHLAFAPHNWEMLDIEGDIDSKTLFHLVIEAKYNNMSRFLKRALPELRHE